MHGISPSKFVIFKELDIYCVFNDEFHNVDRYNLIHISKFGIENSGVKLSVGFGKILSIFESNKNEEYGYFSFGISNRLCINFAKSRIQPNGVNIRAILKTNISNQQIAKNSKSLNLEDAGYYFEDAGDYFISKKFNSFKFGAGFFGNLFFKSKKLIKTFSLDFGVNFYGKEIYEVLNKSQLLFPLKTSYGIGCYLNSKPCIVYLVDDIYIGLTLDIDFEFTGSLKIESTAEFINIKLSENDEFEDPLSRNAKISLNLTTMYLAI